MKSKEDLLRWYEQAKSNYKSAKEDEPEYYNGALNLTRLENIRYRSTQLKMIEDILEIPEDQRIMNSNKIFD